MLTSCQTPVHFELSGYTLARGLTKGEIKKKSAEDFIFSVETKQMVCGGIYVTIKNEAKKLRINLIKQRKWNLSDYVEVDFKNGRCFWCCTLFNYFFKKYIAGCVHMVAEVVSTHAIQQNHWFAG